MHDIRGSIWDAIPAFPTKNQLGESWGSFRRIE